MAVGRNASAGIWTLDADGDVTRSPLVVDRLVFSTAAAGVCVVTDGDSKPLVTFRTAGIGTEYIMLDRKVNGVRIETITGTTALLTVIEKAGTAG